MKILKYNLLLLEKQKLIYGLLCILIMFSMTYVLMVYLKNDSQVIFVESSKTADYLFILNNPFIRMAPFMIVGLPIMFTLLLGDSTWMELKQGTSAFLHTRMDYFKNVLIRYFLSIMIVFLLSCFCFFLNYVSLSLIFGNGNAITHYQSLAFIQDIVPKFFLDTLRNSNPILYSVCLIFHVSTIFGLLAGLSYSLSFIFNNRYVIYVSGVLCMILFECITMIFKWKHLSILLQLQPLSAFGIKDALLLYLILFLSGMGTICMFLFKKKDLLL